VPDSQLSGRVAYLVSSFPVLSETFVLYDALEMEKSGVSICIYPLLRRRPTVTHREVACLSAPVLDLPLITIQILVAQINFLFRQPGKYLRVLYEVLAGSFGSPRYFLGALVFFPKAVFFARDMEARGIDHIHAHFANHPATAAYIISRLTDIPFSFSARGSDLQKDQTMLKIKLEQAEFAIAVSEYIKAAMINTCGKAYEDKVHVVYGGVDTLRFTRPHTGDQRHGAVIKIVCVARFEPVKGLDCLIDACQLLRKRGINFECQLLGEGLLRPAMEAKITRYQLDKEVILIGACSQEEVLLALTHADIAVLATVQTQQGECEGIPNVLKEAMAVGLPVVASDIGGIPELVENGKSGILVPPGDPVALSDALAILADSEQLRKQMGCNGRDKVVKDFNLQSSTRQRASLFLGKVLG